jgi:hypothetical protein
MFNHKSFTCYSFVNIFEDLFALVVVDALSSVGGHVEACRTLTLVTAARVLAAAAQKAFAAFVDVDAT